MRYKGNYGTEADYLTARIARDRKDILERMRAGEYTSVRKAAIDAGIIHTPHPEDKILFRLIDAWASASLEDRQAFLWCIEEELEAVYNGEYQNHFQRRRGPDPYPVGEGAEEIPELEALLLQGETMTGVARQLGVTYRTVARWRRGTAKPSKAIREKLARISKEQ
jgi:hypothetical protein